MLKYVLAFLILAVIAALYESGRERSTLSTETFRFSSDRIAQEIRIVFISDLHSESFGCGNERLTGDISALSPDLILAGGDMFTAEKTASSFPDTAVAADLLRSLSGICPVVYAEGNHERRAKDSFPEEYAAYVRGLSEAGVHILSDGSVRFGDTGLKIYAVSPDMRFYRTVNRFMPSFGHLGLEKKLVRFPEGYLEKALGIPSPDDLSILMLHSPLYFREAAGWGADITLSGHFHGGTIRFPHLGGLMSPQFQFFLRECSGIHRIGKRVMLVNRGLGTHGVKLRLNDIPEISLIVLVPDKKKQGYS